MVMATWLSLQLGQRKDPRSRIHRGLLYPFMVCGVHYFISMTVSVLVHDQLTHKFDCDYSTRRKHWISYFFALYATWLFMWRLLFRKPPRASGEPQPRGLVVYEYTWLCNVTLWQSAFALRTNRPALAMAYCIVVGIDQLLWYIDLGMYAVLGKFPIGVANYLTWPENSNWSSRITCSHHLWTIPLVLFGLRLRMEPAVLPLALISVTVNILLSRWLTPAEVRTEKGTFYLNVNLSYAVWKDIKYRWLQIKAENASAYLSQILCLAYCFNTAIFGVLWLLCYGFFEHRGRPCE